MDKVVTGLSDLGLTYLIFLAGYELDLNRIRGRPLRLATAGYGISLVIGLSAAFALVSAGLALDSVVIGLALTTTAMGTLVPILADADILSTPFGALISAIGTLGEFGPIVAVALLLTKKEPVVTSLLLAAFIVVAVVTVMIAARDQPPRLVSLLNRHLESSATAAGAGVTAVHRAACSPRRDARARRAARCVRRRHRRPTLLLRC